MRILRAMHGLDTWITTDTTAAEAEADGQTREELEENERLDALEREDRETWCDVCDDRHRPDTCARALADEAREIDADEARELERHLADDDDDDVDVDDDDLVDDLPDSYWGHDGPEVDW